MGEGGKEGPLLRGLGLMGARECKEGNFIKDGLLEVGVEGRWVKPILDSGVVEPIFGGDQIVLLSGGGAGAAPAGRSSFAAKRLGRKEVPACCDAEGTGIRGGFGKGKEHLRM